MADIAVTFITNVSNQTVGIGYSAIDETRSVTDVPRKQQGILQLAPSSSIEIESDRIEQGQLEEQAKKRLIAITERFKDNNAVFGPTSFDEARGNYAIGFSSSNQSHLVTPATTKQFDLVGTIDFSLVCQIYIPGSMDAALQTGVFFGGRGEGLGPGQMQWALAVRHTPQGGGLWEWGALFGSDRSGIALEGVSVPTITTGPMTDKWLFLGFSQTGNVGSWKVNGLEAVLPVTPDPIRPYSLPTYLGALPFLGQYTDIRMNYLGFWKNRGLTFEEMREIQAKQLTMKENNLRQPLREDLSYWIDFENNLTPTFSSDDSIPWTSVSNPTFSVNTL